MKWDTITWHEGALSPTPLQGIADKQWVLGRFKQWDQQEPVKAEWKLASDFFLFSDLETCDFWKNTNMQSYPNMNYGELINTSLFFYWIIYTLLVLLQGSLLGSYIMVVKKNPWNKGMGKLAFSILLDGTACWIYDQHLIIG